MPRGEEGEIVTKADYPALFKGYYNQPEKTAEPLRGDGWHRTGDLAHMDSDGYVWFHSRKDDVISSGGYRIGPSEVEGAAARAPRGPRRRGVGKPDEARGQIVKAWVVADAPSDALAAELQQHCRGLELPARGGVHRRAAAHRDGQGPACRAARDRCAACRGLGAEVKLCLTRRRRR